MYDLDKVISYLNNNVPYTITRSKSSVPLAVNIEDLPQISVGYFKLTSPRGTTEESREIVAQAGENITQSFHVTIHCKVENLPTIWRTLHTALIGYNPQPLEEQFSSFGYGLGGIVGLENGKIVWVDRWDLDFPTLNIF